MFYPIFLVPHFSSVSILGSERTYANQLSGLNYTLPRHIALHMTVSSLPRMPSQFFPPHPKNQPSCMDLSLTGLPISAHRHVAPSFLHSRSFDISSHLVRLSILISSIAQQVLIIYIYFLSLSSWMSWASSPKSFVVVTVVLIWLFRYALVECHLEWFGCYMAHDVTVFGNCTLLVPAPSIT